MKRWIAAVAACALVASVASGCASSSGNSGSSPPPQTVVTVVKTAPAQPPASNGSVSGGDPSATGDTAVVPNEVGNNHQAAQDDLQAHGFYNLGEEDATGQGRLLLWDRNWHVVRQSPAPGTRTSVDTKITLFSKKYTDG